MARQIVFLDDLDGSPDAELVTFAVGGVAYEIDLGPANRERFDKSLAEFITHARKDVSQAVPRRKSGAKSAGPNTQAGSVADKRAQTQAIRDWARTKGMEVAVRGRIPSHVVDAFNQEHGTAPTMPKPEDQRRLNDEANRILKQQPKVEEPKPDLPTAAEMAALHEESKAFAPARPAKAAPPALFSAPEQTAAPEQAGTEPKPEVIYVTRQGLVEWMESQGMSAAGLKHPARVAAFKKGHPNADVRYVKDTA